LVCYVIIYMINLIAVIQLIGQLKGFFYKNHIISLCLAITLFSFEGKKNPKHLLIKLTNNNLIAPTSTITNKNKPSMVKSRGLSKPFLIKNSIKQFSRLAGFATFHKKSLNTNNTNLIEWGTDLRSLVERKLTSQERKIIQLAPHQKSVIIGLILSDD